jgi:serine/threonine-protein kinase
MKPYEQTYQILSTLGRGGMGSVYLVRHLRLGTLWAMKEVRRGAGQKVDLLGEANMLKRLNHPALPRIIDIYDDAESIYIVEDYIEGVSLDRRLQEEKKFPERQVRIWASQLCNVLRYLHGQKPHPVIYRDMKPGNIMITPDGDVKLVDFGIAREYKKDTGGDTTYLGTRGYAAPEQFGSSQTDARTDIYSLGVTLYHLLTGKSPNEPPYELLPLRQIDPSLSEGMAHIVARCTRGNPEERYQSVAELAQDLMNIESFSLMSRRRRRREILRLAGCCALLVLGISLAALGWQARLAESAAAYAARYEQGLGLIGDGDLDGAEMILLAADASAAGQTAGHLAMVAAYLNAGEWASCADLAEETADAYPSLLGNDTLNFCWGAALSELGEADEAVEKLETANGAAPGNVLYMRYLARAYADAGELDKANELFEELSAVSDDGTTAFVYAGILQAQGEREESAEQYRLCMEKAADSELTAAAYRALTALYEEWSGTDAAYFDEEIDTLLAMQKALPGQEEAFLYEKLATAYYARGVQSGGRDDLSSAVGCFEKLIDLGYGRASTYLNIAIVQQRLQDYAAAEQILNEMLNRYPNNADAYIQMAFLIAEREGTKQQSERDYRPVQAYYELAVENGGSGESLQRLEGVVKDLRAAGWL